MLDSDRARHIGPGSHRDGPGRGRLNIAAHRGPGPDRDGTGVAGTDAVADGGLGAHGDGAIVGDDIAAHLASRGDGDGAGVRGDAIFNVATGPDGDRTGADVTATVSRCNGTGHDHIHAQRDGASDSAEDGAIDRAAVPHIDGTRCRRDVAIDRAVGANIDDASQQGADIAADGAVVAHIDGGGVGLEVASDGAADAGGNDTAADQVRRQEGIGAQINQPTHRYIEIGGECPCVDFAARAGFEVPDNGDRHRTTARQTDDFACRDCERLANICDVCDTIFQGATDRKSMRIGGCPGAEQQRNDRHAQSVENRVTG